MLGELPGRIQPTCSGGLINCSYGLQVGAEFFGDLWFIPDFLSSIRITILAPERHQDFVQLEPLHEVMPLANTPQVNQVPGDPNAAVPYDPNILAAVQQVPQDPNAVIVPQQPIPDDPNVETAQYTPAPYSHDAEASASQHSVSEIEQQTNTAPVSERQDIPKSKAKHMLQVMQKSGDDSEVPEESEY